MNNFYFREKKVLFFHGKKVLPWKKVICVEKSTFFSRKYFFSREKKVNLLFFHGKKSKSGSLWKTTLVIEKQASDPFQRSRLPFLTPRKHFCTRKLVQKYFLWVKNGKTRPWKKSSTFFSMNKITIFRGICEKQV